VFLAAQWLAGRPNSWRDAYSYVDALESGHGMCCDASFSGFDTFGRGGDEQGNPAKKLKRDRNALIQACGTPLATKTCFHLDNLSLGVD